MTAAVVWGLCVAPAAAQVRAAEAERPVDSGAEEQPAPGPALARWLEVTGAQVAVRYRFVETSDGVTTSDSVQSQPQFKARLKFDPRGRYALHAAVGSGGSFTSGWNNTGLGLGDYAGDLAVKHFYVEAAPAGGLTLQVGSLPFARGLSTEVTTYDNDAYFVGERLTLKRRVTIGLDEFTVTTGHLGDLKTPNAFRRLDRLDEHNYWQVLGVRRLHARLALSADLSRVAGVQTWRQGVVLGTAGVLPVDSVRVELYERRGDTADEGFAVTAERKLTKALSVAGGYANVDRGYGGLNADRFNTGARVFVSGSYGLPAGLKAQWFVARGVFTDHATSNATRVDAILVWDLKQAFDGKSR